MNNEIVHIESDRWPLHGEVKSMQLKFWLQMKDYIQEHPDSAVAKVYNMGSQTSPYIKYYEKLENENTEPKECKERIKTEYLERYKRKMTSQLNDDPDSKLGTYLRSNPNLTSNVPVRANNIGIRTPTSDTIQNWISLTSHRNWKIRKCNT